ncbi:MAG: glyoxalase [Deltaproteobacteria bacterium]|nr:glyoxalase [Deltaproteobacteria bacterium]
MTAPNGIHHIALCTADIRAQLDFFNDVLGMKLVGLFWMHGVEGAWHAFMTLDDQCFVSFVQTPEVSKIERELGKTHAGHPGGAVSGGAMQHLALNVDTLDDLLSLRDRIRSRNVHVFGPMDHGMCHSIYFAGPEDLTLEITTNGLPMEPERWIDPEVVEAAHISPEELKRFCEPTSFEPPETPIKQPGLDASQPHMRGYPEKLYEKMLKTPDEVLTEATRVSEPPVSKA